MGVVGTASSTITIVSDNVPTAMTTIYQGTVTPTSIAFSWNALSLAAQDGGDLPIYYQVMWLNGAGTWVALTSLS